MKDKLLYILDKLDDVLYYTGLRKVAQYIRYDIHQGFKSLWVFRREIWNFRPWDYEYNLKLFAKSIQWTSDNIAKYGTEVDESKLLKVEKMNRFVWLVDNLHQGLEIAEAEMKVDVSDFKEWNERMEVYNRAHEIETEMWNEMWDIIKGSDEYFERADGTTFHTTVNGMQGWWD